MVFGLDRSLDGEFSMPYSHIWYDRMVSDQQKVNIQTIIGLRSYQMPTSSWLEAKIEEDDTILAWSYDRLEIPKLWMGALDLYIRRGVGRGAVQ